MLKAKRYSLHVTSTLPTIMPRLTDEQRYRVVFLHAQELSSREIATEIGCSQQTVLKLLGKYDETGSVRDRPKSGRPRSAWTAQNISACHESRKGRKGLTARSPVKSTRKLANQLGISKGSVTNIYLKDLQQKSFKCLPVQELSEATKRKRLVRCKRLQRRYGYRELQRMWHVVQRRKFVPAKRLRQSAEQAPPCS